MAQSFVGANNINLLTPAGQFGTRRMGGKDSASPRYIFSKLENITRTIFHPDDDELLDYNNEDGLSIEPEFYMPVIPMVLVNGSDGIGTGWSSSVNNYDPRAIIANIRRWINEEPLETMIPHYSGFVGDITLNNKGKMDVMGKIERTDDTTLYISELPLRKWTADYKSFLELMVAPIAKGAVPEIKDFKENHTDSTVSFTITAEKEKIDEWEKQTKGGLFGKFKLTGSLSTTNMHLYNTEDRIYKYDSPEDILKEFCELRKDFYGKRKALLLKKLGREESMLSNKARFVTEVCSGQLIVSNRKKKNLLEDLQERGYDLFDKTKDDQADSDELEENASNLSKGYEYLLGMKIWSLTFEKAEELRAQWEERRAEIETLKNTSEEQIWLDDLYAIEVALDERDVANNKAEEEEKKAQRKNVKHQANKKKKATAAKKGGKKKANEWDSDLEDSDEESDFKAAPTKKVTAPRRKPAAPRAKPASKPTAVQKVHVDTGAKAAPQPKEEPQVDDVELSLAERMKARLVVSPPASKPSLSIGSAVIKQPSFSDEDEGSSRGTKRPSPKASDLDDDEIEVISASTSGKATKSQGKRAKATAATKKPAAKKAPAKRGTKKVIELDESSDDDFDCGSASDSDSDVEMVAAPVARGGRSRAARTQPKKMSYTLDDSEDDDGSDSDF